MNREIRFRAWHTTLNKMFSAEEMAKDQLTLLTTGQFINVHGDRTELSTIYPVDKIIPLQFTGLKDKNGVEIYEGDIYKDSAITYQVRFGECENLGEPFIGFYCEEINNNKNSGAFSSFDSPVIEVIGNIYQNPELL